MSFKSQLLQFNARLDSIIELGHPLADYQREQIASEDRLDRRTYRTRGTLIGAGVGAAAGILAGVHLSKARMSRSYTVSPKSSASLLPPKVVTIYDGVKKNAALLGLAGTAAGAAIGESVGASVAKKKADRK